MALSKFEQLFLASWGIEFPKEVRRRDRCRQPMLLFGIPPDECLIEYRRKHYKHNVDCKYTADNLVDIESKVHSSLIEMASMSLCDRLAVNEPSQKRDGCVR